MNDSKKIVILHNDPLTRSRLKLLVSELGHTPYCFENIVICLDNLNTINPDLVLLGHYPLCEISRFVNFIKTIDPSTPLIITGANDPIREYVASNFFDAVTFAASDFDKGAIKKKIEDSMQFERVSVPADSAVMVGNSPEMKKLRKFCAEISRSAETVLIQGETGTGKDLVARTLHRWSNQQKLPLIKINIAAFKEKKDPIEDTSETSIGAHSGGLSVLDEIFTEKQSGTVYLDGVEHMSVAFQNRIGSYLNQLRKAKLNKDTHYKPGLHIIASTSTDIEALVEKNQFNKDLYYGISVFKIETPPLRKHAEDIPLMVEYIADMHCRNSSNGICEISEDAKLKLQAYPWHGNSRELKETVKRFVDSGFDEKVFEALEDGTSISLGAPPSHDNYFDGEGEAPGILDKNQKIVSMKGVCKQIVVKTEKKMIKEALQHNNWNRKKAARMLDISYRSILNKIKAYRLS